MTFGMCGPGKFHFQLPNFIAARLDKRETGDTLTRAIRLCPTRWAARSFATRYVREFRRTGTASPTRRRDKNETKID